MESLVEIFTDYKLTGGYAHAQQRLGCAHPTPTYLPLQLACTSEEVEEDPGKPGESKS